ncbi:hypothetical protein RCL1_004679 [Eukaryota sp. TZLM3-RCL]
MPPKSLRLGSPPKKVPRPLSPLPSQHSRPAPFSPILSPTPSLSFDDVTPPGDFPIDLARPTAYPLSHSASPFNFQILSIAEPEESTTSSIYIHPTDSPNCDISSYLTAYGITPEGHSVACRIHGFRPYIYIPCSPSFSESDIQEALVQLNSSILNRYKIPQTYVISIEIVDRISMHSYDLEQPEKFLKIVMSGHNAISKVKNMLQDGKLQPGPIRNIPYMTFDSNITYGLQFRLNLKLSDFMWVELPANAYVSHANYGNYRTQYLIDCSWRNLVVYPEHPTLPPFAPLRVLSLDIEVAGRQGVFPQAEHDPVIQIACTCQTSVHEENLLSKTIFVLGSCLSIAGVNVRTYSQERDLLSDFSKFLLFFDPDIVTGYNSEGFDIPYIIDRGNTLKIPNFFDISRVKGNIPKPKDTKFVSNQVGMRETKNTEILGRISMDVLHSIQTDHKLRSYTLNSVALHFLGEQKEDVHHSAITGLFKGSADDRRRLAVYCVKDAYLPLRLINHLKLIVNLSEMAKVTCVGVDSLLGRGQQIKVLAQIYLFAGKRGFIVPNLPKASSDESYEGATVIEPQRGFHRNAISVLDFASLYPSIMMAHNLCYSTLIPFNQISRHDPQDYTLVPTIDGSKIAFIKKTKRTGILPDILSHLLDARKQAKKLMKETSDPSLKVVYDGRQLALKITANSVYGFTGASVGKMPCPEIAASVTAFGREMIQTAKSVVEGKYPGSSVVYGDTDSVMIDFNVKSVAEAIALGHEAARDVTSHFERPISLEFEKVYSPFLLISKKRYAGLLWQNSDSFNKIDAKGIETVRRDNCPLVAKVVTTCLNKILIDKDVEGAMKYAQSIISDLLQNKLDLSLLVISKQLTREEANYSNPQPHTECAKKMAKRDPGSAPTIGSRVAYVIIQGSKSSKIFERAEDPIYVLENNLSLDTDYYLEHQLINPLVRIFEPINPKAESMLLHGEHTRKISRSYGGNAGLLKFTKKVPTCLGCRARLTSEEVDSGSALCLHCADRKPELIADSLAQFRQAEHNYSRIWTQCQRCAGNMHQKVLCESRDCPIFYLRRKVQKEFEQAQNNLTKFENLDW